MTGLKLGRITEEKPIKITLDLPAGVHRDLVAYGEALAREMNEAAPIDPARLIAPMLTRFMATDRAFTKARRSPV